MIIFLFLKWYALYHIVRQYYIKGSLRFGVSCLKIPPTNQPNIYFVTAWQHWLDIAKPKNVFRSTVNLFIKLLWNFKISYLTDFSTDWLSDFLMPSDKRNSITTRAMGSISSLFNIASSQGVPFCQPLQLQYSHHGSTKAYLCFSLFFIPFSTST